MNLASTAAATLGAIALTACTIAPKPMVPEYQQKAQGIIAEGQAKVLDSEKARVAAQDVDRPFLAATVVPLPKDVKLPQALRQNMPVTAMFSSGAVSLQQAARQVTMASRVSISITPDALLPASMFGPRTSASAAGGQAASQAAQGSGGGGGQIYLSGIAQSLPLFRLLDEIAQQAHVSWRVQGEGVEFYRTQTQVFKLNALPTVATATASSGRTTSGANFAADSKTAFALEKQDPIAGIVKTVSAMLTTGGNVTASPEDQTLVVTDIPEVMERVAKHVQDINRSQGRSVRLVVEAFEVVYKDNEEQGFDWNLFYTKLGRGAVNITSPTSIASTQTGSVGFEATAGRFLNSEVLFKALSDVGTVVNRRTFPLVTRSGRPATHTIGSTFNYVDSVQVNSNTATLSNNTPAPSVVQKEETVGTILTLIPKAMDSGEIFLNFAFDVSTNEPLRPFTVGSSSNQVTVQQKTINRHSALQEVTMRSGETILVGGIDVASGANNNRRLVRGASLLTGGSDQALSTRSHIALLVTAITQDN